MLHHLDKPGLLVLVLLVHVELDQIHLQLQSRDTHQHRPAVRRAWVQSLQLTQSNITFPPFGIVKAERAYWGLLRTPAYCLIAL